MQTNYQKTAAWLKACGKQAGIDVDLSVQVGCHIEELTNLKQFAEMEVTS